MPDSQALETTSGGTRSIRSSSYAEITTPSEKIQPDCAGCLASKKQCPA